MWTNANGATSSSTTTAARGSRRRLRPLTESPQVVKSTSSPSSANHTGITCGCPSGPLVASLAVRVPWLRNARISAGVMLRGIDGLLPDRRANRLAPRDRTGGQKRAARARGLQLEHQVGAVDRGCGGKALSGRLEPARDALEGQV